MIRYVIGIGKNNPTATAPQRVLRPKVALPCDFGLVRKRDRKLRPKKLDTNKDNSHPKLTLRPSKIPPYHRALFSVSYPNHPPPPSPTTPTSNPILPWRELLQARATANTAGSPAFPLKYCVSSPEVSKIKIFRVYGRHLGMSRLR